MSGITGLGHVGIYCRDLKRMREFYTGFLGLTIADEEPGRVCFLSAAPEAEHHELVLVQAKESDQKTLNVQQVSFKSKSLDGVRDLYQRLKKHGMKIDRTVTHGNACSVYFFDPEDNRLELYFTTPFQVRQPCGEHIDWERSNEELLAFAQSFEEKKGPPRGAQDPC